MQRIHPRDRLEPIKDVVKSCPCTDLVTENGRGPSFMTLADVEYRVNPKSIQPRCAAIFGRRPFMLVGCFCLLCILVHLYRTSGLVQYICLTRLV